MAPAGAPVDDPGERPLPEVNMTVRPSAALALASAALSLAACTSDLTIPPDVMLTCTEGVCPSGWTCNTHLTPPACVPSDQVDTTPPSLSNHAIDPSPARLGTIVRATFTVSEPLGAEPDVAFVTDPPLPSFSRVAAESSGESYVYEYVADGTEPRGVDLAVRASLRDTQGLAGEGLVGSVRFDFLAPEMRQPVLSGSPATTGATVRLAFDASEELSADPVARIGGVDVVRDAAASSGLHHEYTYVSSGTESEDPAGLPVTVDLVDVAGNDSGALDAGRAVFDRTPPALDGPAALSSPAASLGTLVRVTFTVSEDLASDPVVTLGAIALDRGARSGRTWVYGHVAAPGDPEGTAALSISLVDLAGNAAVVPGPDVTLDFKAPVVSDLEVCDDDGTAQPCAAPHATFSAVAGHDVAKVSFTLDGPAGVEVSVGTAPLVAPDGCASADGLAWTCIHHVVDPAAGTQPRVETAGLYVTATDAAGNRTLASTFVTRDFQPPRLAGSALLERCDGYGPARLAIDDLWTKPIASYGCEYSVSAGHGPVRVSFTLDEAVPVFPIFSGLLDVRLDDGSFFWPDPDASSGTQFSALMTTDPAEGVRQVLADVRDAVGNEATLLLGTLRVDRTPPPALATSAPGLVSFQRFPWGADATRGAKAYYLAGAAGAVVPGSQVVAYDGPDPAKAAAIGRAASFVDGSFGGPPGSSVAFSISSGNVPEVFVAQEDAAGNSSAPALVWDGQWVATPGYRAPGDDLSNPNRLLVDPAFRPVRYAPTQLEPSVAGELGVSNQGVLATVGTPDLRDVSPWAGIPEARGGCAAAWDGDLGRIVMQGGSSAIRAASSYNTTFYGETWSFDSGRWTQLRTTGSPGGRDGHAMAYDPVRQRVVLFGGRGPGGTLLDTWELSGSRWSRVCWPGCATGTECTCTTSPPAPLGFAFFDSAGKRVIGATGGQTWAWDGTDWTPIPTAHAAPTGQAAASPELGNALVLGAGTFTFTGGDWAFSPATPPFDTGGHPFQASEIVLWWDPGLAAYLAWDPYPNQLFSWDGTAWAARPAPSAVPGDDLFATCGAYSRDEGSYLRFGGCTNGFCNVPEGGTFDTSLRLTPDSAIALTPGVLPAARTRATLGDFRDQGLAWLIRGVGTGVDPLNDDWSWDGHRWLARGTSPYAYVDAPLAWLGPGRLAQYGGQPFGPSGYFVIGPYTLVLTAPGTAWTNAYDLGTEPDQPQSGAPGNQALAWDPNFGAVFFGTGGSTWSAVWSDVPVPQVVWTSWPSAPHPPSVRGHRMAFCAGAGGVVLFGGDDGAGTLFDETWIWNGTWTQLFPASPPPARTGHTLFCDERRDKIYVFGGTGAAGPLGDLWQFDGQSWTELTPSLLPDARSGAAGAFLSALGRGVLFGGAGSALSGETWDFDGGRDRRPAHLFHASFASASTGPATITGAGATWAAMASSSFPDPGPSYLADLQVRDGDLWLPVGGGNFDGAPITWSTDTDPAFTSLTPAARAERLRALLGGDRLDLSLAATPHGTNDVLSPGATLSSTYVEATVRYRLLCLAAGARTTNPQRCCSGVATGAACN